MKTEIYARIPPPLMSYLLCKNAANNITSSMVAGIIDNGHRYATVFFVGFGSLSLVMLTLVLVLDWCQCLRR
jgi:hypothetical protein